MKSSHNPLSAALEIREQLASDSRQLCFLFGAGTSMAVGLPGIVALTQDVVGRLPQAQKTHFARVCAELPTNSTIETVLDRIRTLRDLIGESANKEYDGLKRNDVATLDSAICKAISEIVRTPPSRGLLPHKTFAQWIRALHSRRDWPVEVFTTNYDLFIELAMEGLGVPFFDGFVGSVEAFFAPESVEATAAKWDQAVYPPRAWTRLWKLHGSVNWRVRDDSAANNGRIFRTSGFDCKAGEELAVFPSHDKYSQSRKLPFLALQDRFRKYLAGGECLLVLLGYSFSDQHLNEIIFQGLRSNPHLAATAFLFETNKGILAHGTEYRNLAIYTPEEACIGGIVAPWESIRKGKVGENAPFWDEAAKKFTLGDFNNFAKFLEAFIGFRAITITNDETARAPVPLEAPTISSAS
jgi:hypothetical protein